MGWFQTTIWNNLFMYAYPVSFLGAIFYGILAVAQTDVSNIITNKNWLIAFNVIIGLSGLLALAHWFDAPLDMVDGVTGIIDLNLTDIKKSVKNTP
jgi:hypothetical protein